MGVGPFQIQKSYKNIDVSEFKKLSANGDTIILDVRTDQEFTSGHIAGAEHVNVLESDFLTHIRRYDPNKTYLIYCRSGNRSRRAARIMAQAGFEHLYNLKGGYLSWTQKN